MGYKTLLPHCIGRTIALNHNRTKHLHVLLEDYFAQRRGRRQRLGDIANNTHTNNTPLCRLSKAELTIFARNSTGYECTIAGSQEHHIGILDSMVLFIHDVAGNFLS